MTPLAYPLPTRPSESSMVGLTSTPSSVYIITSDGRILKLPIPSSSLKDPLNWCLTKRIMAFVSLLLFTITALTQVIGSGVLLPELLIEYQDTERGVFRVELLASAGSLFTGLGAFLWVPLSLAIGRRPVLLICNTILVLGTIAAAVCQNYWQHFAGNCIQGLALAIMPSLIILMIIDLTFVHQRATAISLFSTLCGVCSNTILTSIPVLIKRYDTWRSFYAAGIGPSILSFIIALFFYPETYFVRPPVAFDGRILQQSSSEKIFFYDNWSQLGEEKALPDLPTTYIRLKVHELKFWRTTTNGSFKAMARCYPQILLSLFNPMVLWVMLVKALILGIFIAFGVTFPGLLTSAPYNLPIEKLVLIYLSAAAGALLSFPLAGPMMSRISLGLASRNGGRQNAEHYLAGFVLPILLGFGGQLLYGFAGGYLLPLWTIFLAYAMISLSFISLYTATALWSTEVFPRWAAACISVVSGGAYVISFALKFSIAPWIKQEGFAKANGELAGLFLLVGCAGIPLAIWGKRFREYIDSRWGESEAGALRPN